MPVKVFKITLATVGAILLFNACYIFMHISRAPVAKLNSNLLRKEKLKYKPTYTGNGFDEAQVATTALNSVSINDK